MSVLFQAWRRRPAVLTGGVLFDQLQQPQSRNAFCRRCRFPPPRDPSRACCARAASLFTCCPAMDGSITALISSARLSCSTDMRRPASSHWNRPCIHVASTSPKNGPFIPSVQASPVTARRARSTEAFISIYSPRGGGSGDSCKIHPALASLVDERQGLLGDPGIVPLRAQYVWPVIVRRS